jgi:diacylglycerol kinase family enzyme
MRESTRRKGISKWTAMLLAVLKTFRRFPLVRVRLETDQDALVRKTPLVFVGNNEYQLDLLKVGKRTCLDGGNLSLYVANTQSRWGVMALTLRALFGRLRQSRDFEERCVTQCWIESRRKKLHVALDGEVLKLHPPLHYRIWPGALRVAVSVIESSETSDVEQSRTTSAVSV